MTPNTHLAHTRENPRGLFIDRWGTLLALPRGGYAKRPSELEFLPGALEALFHAGRLGWKIYLIGNEDAVAEGKQTRAAWEKIEARIAHQLGEFGVPLTRSYACLENGQGQGPRAQSSVFRLPETGVFYHAEHNDGLDLSKSWVIGDSTLELAAGWRADLHTMGVRTGHGLSDGQLHVEPAIIVADLPEAIACLRRAGAEAA